jgi:NADH-quinone oxidoreductase subunit A
MSLPDAGTVSPPVTPAGVEGFISFALYSVIAVSLILLLMFLAWFLGQRTTSAEKNAPYESAVDPIGDARLSGPVPFYLVAIFFIVFDLEAVFIVSWAVAYDLLGWSGFWQISFFIVNLFLGLVYLWKMGALDWGVQPARNRRRRSS